MELYHGDCLEKFIIVKDESVDLILVDLPYGTTQNEWDSVIDCEEMWKNVKRVLKPCGNALFFCKMPFTAALMNSTNLVFHQELIWKKNVASNFLNANKMHLEIHETILVFKKKKGQSTFNKQMNTGVPYSVKRKRDDSGNNYGNIKERIDTKNEGTRNPQTILEYNRPPNNIRSHPTQKPVDLLEYLIRTFSNSGDCVLDFTMGSGSTGVACIKSKRYFIGIEKDFVYFSDAKKRLDVSEDRWKEIVIKRNKMK